MELCLFWITTIICSFGMNISVSYKMIKDLADNGYKLNLRNIEKLCEQMKDDNVTKIDYLKTLIPILNIMESIDLVIKYNNKREFIIDCFRVSGTLEEMTKEEVEIYMKKPTGLNASKLSESVYNFYTSIKFNNGDSIAFFRFFNSRNIQILKIVGPASSFSKEEIVQAVRKEFLKLSFKEMNKLMYSSFNKTVDLDSIDGISVNIYINLIAIDDSYINLTSREKIEELTKAKEELLTSNENENNVKTKSFKNNK